MTTITIHQHPTDEDSILIRCGEDGNAIMGRIGMARLSAEHRAYVLAGEHLPRLRKIADNANVHILDQRGNHGATPTGHAANPLPECTSCGVPRKRNRVDDDGNVTEIPAPAYCSACAAPWVDHHYRPPGSGPGAIIVCTRCGHRQAPSGYRNCAGCGSRLDAKPEPVHVEDPLYDDDRDMVTVGDAVSALEIAAAKGAKLSAEQARINRDGLAMVRESIRLAAPISDPGQIELARTVACHWCDAKPGDPCATDHGLVLAAVHTIRVEFSGGVNA